MAQSQARSQRSGAMPCTMLSAFLGFPAFLCLHRRSNFPLEPVPPHSPSVSNVEQGGASWRLHRIPRGLLFPQTWEFAFLAEEALFP